MKWASIIGLLLLAALAIFFGQGRRYSDREHERFQAGLWRLKHLDASFNEDLLRARFSLLESYDDFDRYLQELEQLTADLHHAPRFVGAAAQEQLSRSADKFALLLRERRQLLEHFKSRNATLANSRRYFPVAAAELSDRLGNTATDRELQASLHELTRVLLAHAATAEALPPAVLARPEQLQAWTTRHPQHPEAAFVTTLVRHAQQQLAGKTELDLITRQLLGLAAAQGIESFSQIYETELTAALRRSQLHRSLLYVLGALLVLGVGYTLWAQRTANRGLEAHVAERTRQLQSEVEERRRAEERVQASEAFLQSLVENLPVFIFRKDRAGRLTFVNDRFCERAGLRREELLGKTVFDLMPAQEAELQQRVDEQVMTSGQAHEVTEEQTKRDGERAFIQLVKVPVFDATGQCTGVQGMFLDVTERKHAEAELERLHRQLLDTSRQAGMAEVATGVLHNVGNVLNSVNVSATLVADHVRTSKCANVAKLAAMFRQHRSDLPRFLTADPRGQMIPEYLDSLTESLAAEQKTIGGELDHLRKNVEHIKEIVAMQQSYARTSGVSETVTLVDLVEDALRMNAGSLARHDVELTRDFQVRPTVTTDRHKVVQILINLIRNAKLACDDSGRTDKRILVRIAPSADSVAVSIIDNGVGIPAENLTRIFAHGFTTRKTGHGFGLHSGALAAKELGGTLTVQSEGPGRGAAFTLSLPYQSESPAL